MLSGPRIDPVHAEVYTLSQATRHLQLLSKSSRLCSSLNLFLCPCRHLRLDRPTTNNPATLLPLDSALHPHLIVPDKAPDNICPRAVMWQVGVEFVRDIV